MSDLASFAAAQEDDIVVGVLSGEVDLSNATALELLIAEAVPNSVRGLVLDLSALSYIDSSGIRLLLSLAGSLRWRGQDLVLAVPVGSQSRRVFAMAGIEDSVSLEATGDAARARLRADGSR
jgi:anti-anti-sigma factor